MNAESQYVWFNEAAFPPLEEFVQIGLPSTVEVYWLGDADAPKMQLAPDLPTMPIFMLVYTFTVRHGQLQLDCVANNGHRLHLHHQVTWEKWPALLHGGLFLTWLRAGFGVRFHGDAAPWNQWKQAATS